VPPAEPLANSSARSRPGSETSSFSSGAYLTRRSLTIHFGSLPAAKQSSTARVARRQFNPIQTQIRGSRLFVRRVPDPGFRPAPRNDFKTRPGSFESLSGFDISSRHRLKSRTSAVEAGGPGEAPFHRPPVGQQGARPAGRFRPQPARCNLVA
jgi:hypothetical protein